MGNFVQKRFTSEYTEALCRLLPKGVLWYLERYYLGLFVQDSINSDLVWEDSITPTTIIYKDSIKAEGIQGDLFKRLLSCFAAQLEKLEAFAIKYVNYTDPGNCDGTFLEDWERNLGLPGICMKGVALTEVERQKIARNKFLYGAQKTDLQFYYDVAEDLGYSVTVEEGSASLSARIIGVAEMGLERMGGYGAGSHFTITIHSGTMDNQVLKCLLEAAKPAHSVITWIEE